MLPMPEDGSEHSAQRTTAPSNHLPPHALADKLFVPMHFIIAPRLNGMMRST
jgi:hypothetical protein